MRTIKKPLQDGRDYMAGLEMRRDQSVSNLKRVLMTNDLTKPNRELLDEALRLIGGIKI